MNEYIWLDIPLISYHFDMWIYGTIRAKLDDDIHAKYKEKIKIFIINLHEKWSPTKCKTSEDNAKH